MSQKACLGRVLQPMMKISDLFQVLTRDEGIGSRTQVEDLMLVTMVDRSVTEISVKD